jgi:glutamate dehydrogenase/leucine dehydrogenase
MKYSPPPWYLSGKEHVVPLFEHPEYDHHEQVVFCRNRDVGLSAIIGDPVKDKTETRLIAFARFVQGLAGQYWTAEDIGIGIRDVEILARGSDYVFGLSASGVQTGDPSPFTARGCFQGILAAVQHRFGRRSLEGMSAAVQGVGNDGRPAAASTVFRKCLHRPGKGLP